MPDLNCGSRNLGDSRGWLKASWKSISGVIYSLPMPAQSSLCKIESCRTPDGLETVPKAIGATCVAQDICKNLVHLHLTDVDLYPPPWRGVGDRLAIADGDNAL